MIQIYDSDGSCYIRICRELVDKILYRVAEALFCLQRLGISVERYNFFQNPKAYYENDTINDILEESGFDSFPITILDGKVVLSGRYPTNRELAAFARVNEHALSLETNI